MTTQSNTPPAGGGSAVVALPQTLLRSRELLFNRELSLLEFFSRVLEEAEDATQPPLERLKFLSILSANVDEFFMIRVSGLKEELEQEVVGASTDGRTPEEQLAEIRRHILGMTVRQTRCLRDDVLPRLKEHGVEIAAYKSLSKEERNALSTYFEEEIFPVLTPQGVDPSHPFPYISGQSLNIGVMVAPVAAHGITRSLTGKVQPRFVRIKVPPVAPRFVRVGQSPGKFVLVEDLIIAHSDMLFPRMAVGSAHLFRVTRDADVDVRDYEADDLLQSMEQTLRKRRFGKAVRVEVTQGMPPQMLDLLKQELELGDEDVYESVGPLDLTGLMQLYKLDRPDLKDRPLVSIVPPRLKRAESIFDAIRERDVFLHHPYNSYSTVVDFMEQAAKDPAVVAIKMCLYRTGHKSPVPKALIEASEAGKQVTALVELKARFDEEANIEWAKKLEKCGVHVVYGILGLKTHCKVALVLRREEQGLRRYVHIATGNYNPVTASVYTDFSLLTADDDIGADAGELFNFLTGFSRQKEYRRLLVAPVNLKEGMLALIAREREHHLAGRPARITAKLNRIADVQIIRALYEASQAGVPIDLVVRGVCMLRPGVPGLSETIRVRSVVGRFLEHSRVYHFENGGSEEVYVGSADWMSRNLDRRLEVIAPVLDARIRRYLKDVVLAAYLRDNTKARVLRSDGTYARVPRAPGEQDFNSQLYFEGNAGLDAEVRPA
jgi:polyphosphate kinase